MDKSKNLLYRIIAAVTRFFYPKIQVVGAENIPQEPCILVGNHAQVNGPIMAELYMPVMRYIWCAQEMMDSKAVPGYAYRDFWSGKPRWSQWLYKILSYLIAPLCVLIFRNAHTIPVYRDNRVIKTYRETLEKLKAGISIVIYPEHNVPHNHILCDFQPGFVDVARSYYKQTGKPLQFVPMYLAPKLKKLCFGQPVAFDPSAPTKEERSRICGELMQRITDLADSLPLHIVVPYNNISKKDYGYNRPQEASKYENASG